MQMVFKKYNPSKLCPVRAYQLQLNWLLILLLTFSSVPQD